ncbi:MAG: hypothetical protein WA125_16765 [Desulfosporosinus sp.]
MKIAIKLLGVIRQIPNEQAFAKINEALLDQKLITQIQYELAESKERTTAQGVVWQLVTMSCKLTILDVESDETIVNIAFGSGVDQGDKAVAKAGTMAWRYAWLGALNIAVNELAELPTGVKIQEQAIPEFVTETPESKLIAHITALWKWDHALFPDYVLKRFSKPIEQLNITELSVLKTELENYGR